MKRLSRLALTALAIAAAGASLPASAVQVTWYVTGHMETALPGTPADLLALAPAGAVFTASFSFDSAVASKPLEFTSDEYFYQTTSALASTTLDVNGNHWSSTGTSTIIEEATGNGEQLTLNGDLVTGPAPARYVGAALDVLTIDKSTNQNAAAADKWPWFSPFGGAQGAFALISTSAPPDISLATYPAQMDLFFPDANGNSDHLLGTVEAISTTPFAIPPVVTAAVPEPGTWALMVAGLAIVGGRRLRRRRG